MKFLVAVDSHASFKEITCNEGTDTSIKESPQPTSIITYKSASGKYNRVAKITGFTYDKRSFVALVRNNYTLQIFAVTKSSEINSYDLVKMIPLEPVFRGKEKTYETRFIALGVHCNEYLFLATEEGFVFLISIKDIIESVEETTWENASRAATKFVTALKSQNSHEAPIRVVRKLKEQDYDSSIKVSFADLNCNIQAFTSGFQYGVFAYGGKDVDLRIISLLSALQRLSSSEVQKKETAPTKQIFEAKNVKNDRLDLQQPIWISNIAFLEDTLVSSYKPSEKSGYKLITSTYYGEIRQYDTSHGRKPVSKTVVFPKLHNMPVKILGMLHDTVNGVLVLSDDRNSVVKLDSDTKRNQGKFVGPQGAANALSLGLDDGVKVVLGGLDKYVRVYNMDSREQVAKVFVDSRISCVWMERKEVNEEEEKEQEEEKENSEDDSDDMWDQMDEIEEEKAEQQQNKTNKKRRTK